MNKASIEEESYRQKKEERNDNNIAANTAREAAVSQSDE